MFSFEAVVRGLSETLGRGKGAGGCCSVDSVAGGSLAQSSAGTAEAELLRCRGWLVGIFGCQIRPVSSRPCIGNRGLRETCGSVVCWDCW